MNRAPRAAFLQTDPAAATRARRSSGARDEPVFSAATDEMLYEDNFDAYPSTTYIWQHQNDPGPRPSFYGAFPNPGSFAETYEYMTSPGYGGSGKALTLYYPSSANLSQQNDKQVIDVVHLPAARGKDIVIQYWFRVTMHGALTHPVLMKWLEVWPSSGHPGGRTQWSLDWSVIVSSTLTYWGVNPQSRGQIGEQPVRPWFNDVVDGRWRRATVEFKTNSASGAADGWARMWIDGVKIIDIEKATEGVTPPRALHPWCRSGDTNQLLVNDGIEHIGIGSVEMGGGIPSFTLDIDNLKYWRKGP